MKKIILSVFILMVIFIVACQQAAKKEVGCTAEAFICPDGSAVGRTGPNCEFAPCPTTGATGDAAVDAVGNDLTNVDAVEKDLGTEELDDLDAGLADIQTI